MLRPCALCLTLLFLLTRSLTADDSKGIWVVRPDGTGIRKVIQVPFYRHHGSPRWSHDGKRLAFDASEGINGMKRFFTINADGTKPKEGGEHGMPDWSPDDKQIVYNKFGTSPPTIWVQNVDGQGREQLGSGLSPRWSPDGGKIAYTDLRTMRVLDLAEGNERLLFDEPLDQSPIGFDWSRDGKRVAFVGRRAGQQSRELIIVDAAEVNPQVTIRYARQGNLDGHVSWSPDGKQLVVVMDGALHLIDVAGQGDPHKIPGQTYKCRDPAWSPDGGWIAFARIP